MAKKLGREHLQTRNEVRAVINLIFSDLREPYVVNVGHDCLYMGVGILAAESSCNSRVMKMRG